MKCEVTGDRTTVFSNGFEHNKVFMLYFDYVSTISYFLERSKPANEIRRKSPLLWIQCRQSRFRSCSYWILCPTPFSRKKYEPKQTKEFENFYFQVCDWSICQKIQIIGHIFMHFKDPLMYLLR